MVASTGLFKNTVAKAETTWNTAAGASGAQLFRRTQAMFKLKADNYRSNEIRANRQLVDFRLGTQSAEGNIDGELSPGTYSMFMAAMLAASSFTGGVNTGAQTDITAAAGPPGTFTTAGAINFLTLGFKVGDIIRWAGWATGGSTANNARNYRITALTATVMTVGTAATGASGQPEAVVAQAAGDSVTATVVGKKCITPQAGSLADTSFSIEQYFSDNTLSELFTGCKPTQMDISLPASGLATVKFTFMGGGLTVASSAYFTSPTALTTEGITAAVNGKLRVNGADVADITSLNISVKGGHTTEKVVGSNQTPGVFPGVLDVTGTFTALWDTTSSAFRDAYLAETAIAINSILTVNGLINSDFIAFNLPKIKITDAGKDDKPTALTGTYPFQALENTAGGASTTGDDTTLCIQDSNA